MNEINFLSHHWDLVTHIAPVIANDIVPQSYSPVSNAVKFIGVRNRGGNFLRDKIRVLGDSFGYAKSILNALKQRETLVHVRCPANISFIALLVLIFYPLRKKWIKYAGDWRPQNDFFSYRSQRFIIRHFLRNQVVTVNGYYSNEKGFIHYFLNPSFTLAEVNEAALLASPKRLHSDFFQLLFVGALEKNKGTEVALMAFKLLTARYPGELVVIGDGSEAGKLLQLSTELGLDQSVHFEGWRNREEIKAYYEKAHFIILPSQGEGWPKVISEAMTFGVVPIVSDVSGVSYTLSRFETGSVINEQKAEKYSEAIAQYCMNTNRWELESKNAVVASYNFSLEVWFKDLNRLFAENLK